MARTFIAMRWLLVALLGLGLWLTLEATYGQSRELLDAPNKSITLYGQGRYQDALPLGEKAVRLGEQELGANHQTNAVLRSYLAVLYQAQGRYTEAEPLYKRALAIAEKALGADHPGVTTRLANLALLYRMAWPRSRSPSTTSRTTAISSRVPHSSPTPERAE